MPSRRRRSRSRPDKARWSRARIARAAAVAFAALALALVVVRVWSTEILLSRGHPAVALMAPDDPAVVYQLAVRNFASGGGADDEASFRRVAQAARATPLAEEPFFFAAARQLAGGERARVIRLLEEARRRNPRMRLARLLLVDQYIRAGRVDDAATEIRVLSGLALELSGLLVDQLTRLAADPETRPALRRALGSDPLLDQVLAQLVRGGASADLVLEIAEPRLAAYDPADPPRWQGDLVAARVAAGAYREAYRLWQRFGRARAEPNAIYNPGFGGAPGSPPFNWAFSAGSEGVAEPARDGGLEVVYFGRGDVELARQLLMLAPGRYRLEASAAAVEQGDGSHLAWRVACAAGDARLAELGLDRLATEPRTLAAEFAVPPGCDAQWLRLVGEAGEFANRREVRIDALRLRRLGGGR